jgi:hypothetical protein
MTRAERAAEKVRKEKERLAEQEREAKEQRANQRKAIAQAEAAQREETRKADNKRRYHVGALAQEAGLFVWSNSDLKAVFAVLGRLGDTPNPAAFLEGFLETYCHECGGDSALLTEKSLSRFDSRFEFSAQSASENSDVPSPQVSEGRLGEEDADNPPAAAGVFVKVKG